MSYYDAPARVTPAWVRGKVNDIKGDGTLFDDEAAHGHEDWLYRTILEAIRDGRCSRPAECARIALEVASFEFHRWCA